MVDTIPVDFIWWTLLPSPPSPTTLRDTRGVGVSGESGGFDNGATYHADDLPVGGSHPLVGGRRPPTMGLPPDEPLPVETDRYLKEVLEPSALQTYRDLLLDPDPKVRRQAASDIMEMQGRKGKVAPNLGGLTFQLAPERMDRLIGGLSKVFQKPKDVVDVG
jgi:hypothetical protein